MVRKVKSRKLEEKTGKQQANYSKIQTERQLIWTMRRTELDKTPNLPGKNSRVQKLRKKGKLRENIQIPGRIPRRRQRNIISRRSQLGLRKYSEEPQ